MLFYVGIVLLFGFFSIVFFCVIVIGWGELEVKLEILLFENYNSEYLYKKYKLIYCCI